MVEVSVKIDDKKLRSSLTELERKLQNLEPALKEIGEYILLATDERFEFQIDPNGQPWRPNSTYTLNLKRQRGQILKVLQATGRMRSSYFYSVNQNKVRVTNKLERARKHQLGIGVPQRIHLGISQTDQQEILAIIDRYLNGSELSGA